MNKQAYLSGYMAKEAIDAAAYTSPTKPQLKPAAGHGRGDPGVRGVAGLPTREKIIAGAAGSAQAPMGGALAYNPRQAGTPRPGNQTSNFPNKQYQSADHELAAHRLQKNTAALAEASRRYKSWVERADRLKGRPNTGHKVPTTYDREARSLEHDQKLKELYEARKPLAQAMRGFRK